MSEAELARTEKIDPTLRSKLSNQAIGFALAANILLALLKTIFGIVGHSTALLADGINSTSDVVYNLLVNTFVRKAHKPADEEHPYGHTQLESIGALVVGAFVVTTALTIFWNSVDSLFILLNNRSESEGVGLVTLFIALFTVALKLTLTIYTHRIGNKTQNPSIIALAQDHRNDIFSASAVVIGVVMSRLGYHWVDPAAGVVVAFVILRTGVSILRESADDLMDTVPGKTLQAQVEEILSQIPTVHSIEEMQAHRFGQYFVINITVLVDGKITVEEGDRVSDHIETAIMQGVDYVRAVHVHFHAYKPGKNKIR